MAEFIERKGIEELELTEYKDIRDKLKSGDLFFASGNSLFSQAIQKVSGSMWSHVGIVFKMKELNRILLLESVTDSGVRFSPLSKYVKDYENGKPYDGICVLARYESLEADQVSKIANFGIGELTRPYDKEELVKILARVMGGHSKKDKDRDYICSELVYECFKKAGITFAYNSSRYISPEDIWKDENVSFLTRIL